MPGCFEEVFAFGGAEHADALCDERAERTIEIVKRPEDAKGFVVLAKRWVVERTFARLGRCRRLAKDWEKSIASPEGWTCIASIHMLSRRLARA